VRKKERYPAIQKNQLSLKGSIVKERGNPTHLVRHGGHAEKVLTQGALCRAKKEQKKRTAAKPQKGKRDQVPKKQIKRDLKTGN